MKAAVMREVNAPLQIEEVQISKPMAREVLIRTSAVGVCHSDLHILHGTYPRELPTILGHESAGIVEQVGSAVIGLKPGDHVITCLSAFCGHCEHCLTGYMSRCQSSEIDRGENDEPRLSQNGTRIHQFANLSSFAEQMLVHEHAVVKIREDMPMDRAALIGCGVTTGAGAVINTAKVRPGTTVAVIGCGGVGLSAINGAAIAGAGRIIAVDMHPNKLELAKQFGATDVVNASEGDPVEQVVDMTNGGVHYSFEAIGMKVTAEQSFRMLRSGGVATVIGMVPVGTHIELHGADLLSERRLQGSMMGSNRFPIDMPQYIEFYLAGKLHLDQLISAHIKLEDINKAMDELEIGKLARQVIMFDH